MLTLPTYVTRERLTDALDAKPSLSDVTLLDDVINWASRSVETRCHHRHFYPVAEARSFDWPAGDSAPGYRLWLGDSEIISLASITSGGNSIDTTAVLLEPAVDGPPYDHLDLDQSTSAAFTGGDTWQRNAVVTGVWAGAPLATETIGTTVEALDSSETGVDVDGPAAAGAGVGDLLVVGSERMLVTGREWLATADTSITLGNSLTASTLAVASGPAYRRGERLLIDAERLQVMDIVGNTLLVRRCVDGTALAAHTTAALYASRTLTVARGFGGTTAAAASSGAAVAVHRYPGEITELALAEAIVTYGQRTGGYAPQQRTGAGQAPAPTGTLGDVRAACEARWRRYRQGAI